MPAECGGGWYRLRYGRQEGYVRAALLEEAQLVGGDLARRHERLIVIARLQQHVEVYQDGDLLLVSEATTGRPALATPLGRTNVSLIDRVHTMRSPWPKGHRFWYRAADVDWAVQFRAGGWYLHDTPIRPWNGFGIGSDRYHQDPDGVWRIGSHGCVNMPDWAIRRIFGWARIGDAVFVLDA